MEPIKSKTHVPYPYPFPTPNRIRCPGAVAPTGYLLEMSPDGIHFSTVANVSSGETLRVDEPGLQLHKAYAFRVATLYQ